MLTVDSILRPAIERGFDIRGETLVNSGLYPIQAQTLYLSPFAAIFDVTFV
ncbi:hypothetical protein [Microcoleus sp. B9-D4]|uniref:hypothetical protein n=1 Tax=Microcoleus sp. B9-D4 TaxID=2818711 RepID=UPI002FCF5EF3